MNEHDIEKRLEETSLVQKLIGLKKYEQPKPDLENRLLRTLHQRIAADEKKPAGGLLPFPSWITPALGYAAALVVLGLLSVRLLTGPHLSPVSTLSWQQDDEPSEDVVAIENAGPSDAPDTLWVVASNVAPSGIQYGSRPSELVDFQK